MRRTSRGSSISEKWLNKTERLDLQEKASSMSNIQKSQFDPKWTNAAIQNYQVLSPKKRRLRNGLKLWVFRNLVIRLCPLSFQRTQSV